MDVHIFTLHLQGRIQGGFYFAAPRYLGIFKILVLRRLYVLHEDLGYSVPIIHKDLDYLRKIWVIQCLIHKDLDYLRKIWVIQCRIIWIIQFRKMEHVLYLRVQVHKLLQLIKT